MKVVLLLDLIELWCKPRLFLLPQHTATFYCYCTKLFTYQTHKKYLKCELPA